MSPCLTCITNFLVVMFISWLGLIAIANASINLSDVCRRVCLHYTAERRGHGQDLCDNNQPSQCSQNNCSHLYWSETEEGFLGLIYSPEEQLDYPVTCEEAQALVRVWESPPTTYLDTALQIFIHLPPVIDILSGPIIQREQEAASSTMQFLLLEYMSSMMTIRNNIITVGSSDRIREFVQQLGGCPPDMNAPLPFGVIGALTGLSHQLPPTADWLRINTINHRQCTICEFHQWSQGSSGAMISYSLNDEVYFDVRETLSGFQTESVEEVMCRACNSTQPISFRSQLITSGVLMFHLERINQDSGNLANTTVTFPYTITTQSGSTYNLIALAHVDDTTNEHYADIRLDGHNHTWYRFYRFMLEPIHHVANISNTVQTLVYHRI